MGQFRNDGHGHTMIRYVIDRLKTCHHVTLHLNKVLIDVVTADDRNRTLTSDNLTLITKLYRHL